MNLWRWMFLSAGCFLCLAVIPVSCIEAQRSDYGWTRILRADGESISWGVDTAVDADGNVYVAGFWYGYVDFDPGPGEGWRTSTYGDIFVMKFKGDGSLLWVRTFAGSGLEECRAIDVAPDGSIYLAGYFSSGAPVDFDPTEGEDFHSDHGNGDAFLVKLKGDGSFAWARTFGGPDGLRCNSVATGPNGEVVIGGAYRGSADFDPGPGEDWHEGDYYWDLFATKFNFDGAYAWTRTAGGKTVYPDNCRDLAIDKAGNIVASGNFGAPADFDPGPGEDIRTSGVGYVWKLDLNGQYQDTVTFDLWPEKIAVDGDNNILLTGEYQGTKDFDPGPGEDKHTAKNESDGGTDIYLIKLAEDGSYIWGRSWGTGGPGGIDAVESAKAIATDLEGSIYLAGAYGMTGIEDIFAAKVQADGGLGWLVPARGTYDDSRGYRGRGANWSTDPAYGVAVGSQGEVYITGSFSYYVDFDPTQGRDVIVASFDESMFLTRWNYTDGEWNYCESIGSPSDGGHWVNWEGGASVSKVQYEDRNYAVFAPGQAPGDSEAPLRTILSARTVVARENYSRATVKIVQRANNSNAAYRVRARKNDGTYTILVDKIRATLEDLTLDLEYPQPIADYINGDDFNEAKLEVRCSMSNRYTGLFLHSLDFVEWHFIP